MHMDGWTCHTYGWMNNTSFHITSSMNFIHMDEACHTCEGVIWCVRWDLTLHRDVTEDGRWVMSYIWMRHVTRMKEWYDVLMRHDSTQRRHGRCAMSHAIFMAKQYVLSYDSCHTSERHYCNVIHVSHVILMGKQLVISYNSCHTCVSHVWRSDMMC